MLKNSDKYEAVKKLQEARELETFNKAWDKANGVGIESTSEKEPYLRYEDLLDEPKKGQTTGQAASIDSFVENLPQKNPYDEIDSRTDWSEEQKALKKAEIAKIQNEAKDRNAKIDKENAIEHAKNWGGALLELGSFVVPGLGGPKLAATVAKKLAPKLGRKIAQEISEGTLKGFSQGAVEGFGRGLATDENPLKTAATDAIAGTALGAVSGQIQGYIERGIRGNKFRKITSLDGYTSNDLKNLRKDGTEFYNDYIDKTTINRPDMDEITFGKTGIKEVKSKGLHNVKILPDLKKQIKTGTKMPDKYDYEREDISNFNIINNTKNGKIYEYQIAKDTANKMNKFYNVKEINDEKRSSLSNWNQYPGSKKNSTNIITPSQNNLNSSQPQTPQPQVPQKLSSFDEWLEELKRKRKRKRKQNGIF